MTIDNGGPPLEIDAKLRWVKVNITEILEGIEELSWEQRGYYLTALFKMYARTGGLPADKYEGAKAMRCDVRFFQRLRDQIVATGKFYVEDGLLKNSRVEREIAEYVREHKKRRDAALEREQRRREAEAGAQANAELHSTSGELPGDFRETSGRSPGEVSDTSSRLEAENSTKSNDAPPQHYHKPLRSCDCFSVSWQGLHRHWMFDGDQNSTASPLCGFLWSATSWDVLLSSLLHIWQVNRSRSNIENLRRCQRVVLYHLRQGLRSSRS